MQQTRSGLAWLIRVAISLACAYGLTACKDERNKAPTAKTGARPEASTRTPGATPEPAGGTAKPEPGDPDGANSAVVIEEIELIGVPACDEYVEKYIRCIAERFDETAQQDARKAVLASARAWREAAQGPDKAELASQCAAQLQTAKRVLANKNCQW